MQFNVLKIRILCLALLLLLSAESPVSCAPVPDDPKLFSGNPVGLTDLDGREIVPPNYARIEYRGHGIYLMTEIDADDKYHLSDIKRLFNRDGEELQISLPPGARLEDIYWMGEAGEDDDSVVLKKLPEDTLLVFAKGEDKALCRKDGTIFSLHDEGNLGIPNEGLAVATLYRKAGENRQYSIVNLRTGERKPLRIKGSIRLKPFCEGVAVFSDDTSDKTGFIDKDGLVTVIDRYSYPQSFTGGFCSLGYRVSPPDRHAKRVIVNRQYKIVSPPNMYVDSFYGDCAVAAPVGKRPTKWGLVDRNFKFLVEPKYRRLMPLLETRNWTDPLESEKQLHRNPVIYIANMHDTETQTSREIIAVSSKGEELFVFPPSGRYIMPTVTHGTIRYELPGKSSGSYRTVFYDFTGHEIPDPVKLPVVSGATFCECGPGRLAMVLHTVSEKFDPLYWGRHGFPGGRLRMVAQFLRQFDLIGMERAKVFALLSNPDGSCQNWQDCDAWSYGLAEASSCEGGDAMSLKIFFRDDRVYQWCFRKGGVDLAPYTINVVFPETYQGRAYGAIEPAQMLPKK